MLSRPAALADALAAITAGGPAKVNVAR
jgi:hypothetical protein